MYRIDATRKAPDIADVNLNTYGGANQDKEIVFALLQLLGDEEGVSYTAAQVIGAYWEKGSADYEKKGDALRQRARNLKGSFDNQGPDGKLLPGTKPGTFQSPAWFPRNFRGTIARAIFEECSLLINQAYDCNKAHVLAGRMNMAYWYCNHKGLIEVNLDVAKAPRYPASHYAPKKEVKKVNRQRSSKKKVVAVQNIKERMDFAEQLPNEPAAQAQDIQEKTGIDGESVSRLENLLREQSRQRERDLQAVTVRLKKAQSRFLGFASVLVLFFLLGLAIRFSEDRSHEIGSRYHPGGNAREILRWLEGTPSTPETLLDRLQASVDLGQPRGSDKWADLSDEDNPRILIDTTTGLHKVLLADGTLLINGDSCIAKDQTYGAERTGTFGGIDGLRILIIPEDSSAPFRVLWMDLWTSQERTAFSVLPYPGNLVSILEQVGAEPGYYWDDLKGLEDATVQGDFDHLAQMLAKVADAVGIQIKENKITVLPKQTRIYLEPRNRIYTLRSAAKFVGFRTSQTIKIDPAQKEIQVQIFPGDYNEILEANHIKQTKSDGVVYWEVQK